MTTHFASSKTRTSLKSAGVLLVVALVAALSSGLVRGSIPDVPTGTWAATGALAGARGGAAAVLLPTGGVLVTGGADGSGSTQGVELFGSDGTFSAVAPMNEARAGHTAVVLTDGRVLVVGGIGTAGAVASAELFGVDSWSPAGGLTDARWGHTATLLKDGRVLVAGGQNGSGAVASLEIFDPQTGAFSFAGTMSAARKDHAAALVSDGRVIIAGGSTGEAVLQSSELFDPATGQLSQGPSLNAARQGLTATSLLDGRVVFVGGHDGTSNLGSAEIFSPVTNVFSYTATTTPMVARRNHQALLLSNNNAVLIVGGVVDTVVDGVVTPVPTSAAELYLPWRNEVWQTTAAGAARSSATGAALSTESYGAAPSGDGLLMIAGGIGEPSSETYRFATIRTDKDDYPPGSKVYVSGSGWQPNEEVTLSLRELPAEHASRSFTLQADGSGRLTNAFLFDVEDHHLGVRFYLTAGGAASQAQVTFTDGNVDFAGKVTSVSTGSPIVGATVVGTCTSGCSTSPEVITETTDANGNYSMKFNYSGSGSIVVSLTASASGHSASSVAAATYLNASKITQNFALTSSCAAASITTQPLAASIAYGSDATFTAQAAGTPVPTVQWQVKVGAGVFTDIPGETSTTLTLSVPTTASTGNQYRAVFTNSCGGTQTATSGAALLTVAAKIITGAFTAANKVYDGNTTATVQTQTPIGVVGSDAVTFTGGTATFDTPSVGNGKTVTLTGATLGGAAAGNYSLGAATSWTTTANITPLTITGAFTAANRAYDGTTNATVLTRTLTGVLGIDDVSFTGGTASFADVAVGDAKTVTLTGATLGGAAAGNYSLGAVTSWTTTANITPLTITGAFTAANKVYDGTTNATVLTRTLTGVVGTEDVSFTGGTASFADATVGDAKTVTLTGATLSGTAAGNYSLGAVTSWTTTANITPLTVTGAFTAANKVYDGNTTATVQTQTPIGVVGSDAVTFTGGTATFDTPSVGNGKTVTLTGATLGGAAAGNYSLGAVTSWTTTANITPLTITGAFTAANKAYDGNTNATVLTQTVAGAIGGDDVTFAGGSATFDSPSVGNGKTVTLTGATLGGSAAGNYSLGAVTSWTTMANITPLTITGAFTAANKVYDGNTTATVLTQTLTGVVGSDAVTFTGGTATFDCPSVGNGKTVTLTGATLTGAAAGNYSLGAVTSWTTTANITPATLTVTADNKTKLLNETNPTFTVTYTGFVNGETLATSGVTGAPSLATTALTDSPVGTYPITATIGTLAASNYTFVFVDGTLTIVYRWDGYLQPINDTAHQIGLSLSKFKLGQTIPAKFQIKDAAGNSVLQVGNPGFNYAKIGATCGAAALDTIDLSYPATTVPVYLVTGDHYQYNWSTKGIPAGLYRIFAILADGTSRSVDICLAK